MSTPAPLFINAPAFQLSASAAVSPMTRRKRSSPGGALRKPARSPFRTDGKFYAVRYGREGFSGVLSSWEECSLYVTGVPGAVFKSFATHNQALAFAAPVPGEPRPKPGKRQKNFYSVQYGRDGFRGVLTTWDECSLYVQGVPGARYKGFATYEEALEFSKGDPSTRPHQQNAPEGGQGSSSSPVGHEARRKGPLTAIVAPIDMAPVPIIPHVTEQHDRLVLYTDGACQGNGRSNSKAGYGVYFEEDSWLNISEPLRGRATNQRAEMMAVLAAIRTVLENNLVVRGGTLEIRTDSQYTKNGVDQWVDAWKKKYWKTALGTDVKNKDLWVALDNEKAKLHGRGIWLSLVWVKGHAGNPGNEAADRLAVDGISRL